MYVTLVIVKQRTVQHKEYSWMGCGYYWLFFVPSFDVHAQRLRLAEALVAVRTLLRQLARMTVHVLHHGHFAGELAVAVRARVRPDVEVYTSEVRSQVIYTRKGGIEITNNNR